MSTAAAETKVRKTESLEVVGILPSYGGLPGDR